MMTPVQTHRPVVALADQFGSDVKQPRALAPPPMVDRYPVVIGSNLSFQYITITQRQALTGYRQPFVDVLSELLDHEPHGFSQLCKRVTAIAGARIEITPCDSDNAKAVEIADAYRKQHDALDVAETLGRLMWALYYGITCEETFWNRDGAGWMIDKFEMVHTRRLSYPDFRALDLYVYDQGWELTNERSQYGLRIADFPNKFVVHTPKLRAEYATREGLGRVLSIYFALKRLIVRVSAQDFERFIRPWVISYFNTIDSMTKVPRVANDDDIADGDAAAKALGAGSLSAVSLPDSIKIELLKAASEMNVHEMLVWLDDSITRCCNGQTQTTSVGKGGSRASSEVAERDTMKLNRLDGLACAAMWRKQVIVPWVSVNFSGQEKLAPVMKIHVDELPKAAEIMTTAVDANTIGIAIDREKLAQQVGIPVDAKLSKEMAEARLKAVKAGADAAQQNAPGQAQSAASNRGAKQPGKTPGDEEE